MSNAPLLSVVSTIYRGENEVEELVRQIEQNIAAITDNYEIVLAEDCGPDNSWQRIEQICATNKKVKAIQLSRNFGQQIAMSAGIQAAKGNYIVIMDGDLQNPPPAIVTIFHKLQEGYDIVYTTSLVRNDLKDGLSSRLFWFVLTKFLKVKIIKNQLMMKGMSRRFVQQFNNYTEISRTVSGITHDIGMQQATIAIQNQKRFEGRSNYSFFRRFNLMIDIVISLSTAPLNFMIFLGLAIFVLTIVASVYYIVEYLLYDITPGFTSIMLAVFFFGGIIILLLGFIGRYLASIYSEVRNRPLYMLQRTCNLNPDEK